MSDNDKTQNEVNEEGQNPTENKPSAKDLRVRFEENLAKKNSEIEKLRKQIAEREQAEADKNKTLEEKQAELELKLKEQEKLHKETKARYQLEKALLQFNIIPELSELMLEKGVKLIDEDIANVNEVVSELQATYKSAFIFPEEKPKPIGNIGLSSTQGGQVAITKEELQKRILDPNHLLSEEENQLADKYGL